MLQSNFNMGRKYTYKILIIFVGSVFLLFCTSPLYAQNSAFVYWLTTPSTQILLGILLLICVSGFPVLLLLKKKSVRTELSTVESMIEDGNLDDLLKEHGNEIRNNTTLTRKMALAMAQKQRTDAEAVTIYEKVYRDGNSPNEITQQLARSYALQSKDDLASLKLYQKAINIGLTDPSILQITGEFLVKRKEWANAASVLTQLITRGNASPETYVHLAHCFLQMQRQDDTALDVYQAAVASSPQDTTLVLALATFYSEKNKMDANACSIYEQALKMKPDLVTVRLVLSRAYLSQRKLTQCIDHCQYLVKRGIMDNEVMRLLAGVYVETEQWEEAGAIYDRLISQSPEEPEYIIGLARTYAGIHRLDKDAFEVYQKALKLNDELVSIWEQLFKIYVSYQDVNAVIRSAEKIIKLSPESSKSVIPELEKLALRFHADIRIPLLLGDIYCLTKQTEYAISSYDRIMEFSPAKETIDRLINGFTRILEYDPNSRDVRMRRAKLFLQQDQIMNAIRDFEWIHEKDGSIPEVSDTLMSLYQSLLQSGQEIPPLIHYNLGKIYEEEKLWQDAILEYQQSAKITEFMEKSSIGMARCFLEMKKLDIAAEQLTKVSLTEEVKDVMYNLANAYRQSENFDKAMDILDKIYEVDSKYRDVGVMLKETKMRSMEAQMEKTTIPKSGQTPVKASRYKIIEEIARGGMGIVCCAMDTVLNEMVALKMLPQDLAQDPQILERFLREVKSTRKLVHRNIVRVYDIVEENGNKYISMEYVVGKNLRQLLREKGRLPEQEVAGIIRQVCLALQEAHEQGIVHRDIKPANIMIDSTNTVKVMDFGIAKMQDAQKLTQTTDFLGTPLYMSPEQTQGLQIDQRSDIYSLGILMYEMLSGDVPFNKGNIGYQHIHVVSPPPTHSSKEMQEIVMKCIEKKPEKRYQDANQLRETLEKLYPAVGKK